jgi:hypothetical protein
MATGWVKEGEEDAMGHSMGPRFFWIFWKLQFKCFLTPKLQELKIKFGGNATRLLNLILAKQFKRCFVDIAATIRGKLK